VLGVAGEIEQQCQCRIPQEKDSNMQRNIRKTSVIVAMASALLLGASAGAAGAEVTQESRFVGKGGVQEAFGWNNATLQTVAADLGFRSSSIETRDYTWTCVNANNDVVQQRSRVETQTVAKEFQSVTRDRKGQVTGFQLTSGDVEVTVETQGPKLNSCPEGPWYLNEEASDETLLAIEGELVLQVSVDGTIWTSIG
jgi:hypothetical protein